MHKEGDILQERYRITALHAEGGMSYLYRVRDERLKKCWALKELKCQGAISHESPEFRQFQAEAVMLAEFSHGAFPAVIDFFIDGGKAYLVEEWIEGETLEALGSREGGIQEETAAKYVVQLLDALEYLHGHGIIYRDLKPQNIIVTRDGSLKLVDFGIARFYKAGQKKDTVYAGTPGYAPPEQYGKGQTDARTDLYALGACLYFMLTGIHPPEDRFNLELPPGTRHSPFVASLVKRAMRQDPAERFQSIQEFRQALEARHRKSSAPALAGLPLMLAAVVLFAVCTAELRVSAFYTVLICLLAYGFVWAVRELRRRKTEK
ncbi:MAG: serine/threonine-protein kinase [Candidatus Eremiobacteraeota bacterium]|nr:serine/threonine-protein kinase [Candidatus Eremiobacteraeota bacterium]